ncbi:MAG: hypothetical protein CMJ05_08525 [Pelagibacterales bacterium]|nr:hypothetical protein [Pelagibacterales bacterium]|tara:strand:- start:14632 stop:16191 length:1560 start_codon:yes stop_codon:yes gene_type:complete
MKLTRARWIILVIFLYLSIFFFTRNSISYFIDKSGQNSTVGKFSDFVVSNYYSKLNGIYIDKYLYFNPQFWAPKRSDLILKFSNNDIAYNDSIIELIKLSKINWVTDEFKQWRNASALYNNKNIDIKYKFHGSSLDQYVNGIQSYSIKSSDKIFNKREFKLITSIDFTYKNIFLTHMAKHFDLIHEEVGEIVVIKDHKKTKDYYLYENFDNSYVKRTYKLSNPNVIRNLTFNAGFVKEAHSSQLDNVSFNIDSDRLSKDVYEKWDNLQKFNFDKIMIDKDYMGRFFSLVYLFGHPHHITGNNDKWVISDEGLFPVYRNEDTFAKLSVDQRYYPEGFNDILFNNYYFSSTHEKYKKLLEDDEIINIRNNYFNKIVEMREKIISDYDSIFKANIPIHKRFNDYYFLMKNSHNKYKRIINHNIDIIEDYINAGVIISMIKDDHLYLRSSLNNKINIKIDGKEIPYLSKDVYLSPLGNLKDSINEMKIFIGEKTDLTDIKFIDLVTNDTLDYESKKTHFIYID